MLELEVSELLRDVVLEEGVVLMIQDYIGEDKIIVDIDDDPSFEYLLKHKYNIDIEFTRRIGTGLGNQSKEYKQINQRFKYKNNQGNIYLNFIRFDNDLDLDKLFIDCIKCGYNVVKKMVCIQFDYNSLCETVIYKYFIKTVITKNPQ